MKRKTRVYQTFQKFKIKILEALETKNTCTSVKGAAENKEITFIDFRPNLKAFGAKYFLSV